MGRCQARVETAVVTASPAAATSDGNLTRLNLPRLLLLTPTPTPANPQVADSFRPALEEAKAQVEEVNDSAVKSTRFRSPVDSDSPPCCDHVGDS